ncbi:MAG: DUF4397 domain-containing protein, partial [Chloroflexi bacterium]|nr:DUF4397 domain-containing protein [Chloroflexota bacterium]
EGEAAEIRIVHGIADAGPLDVYVDGSLALIGISFSDMSGGLAFSGGEHDLAVVPTGASRDNAIAAGTITLENNTRSYAALLGTGDAASVGIFPVDDRSLDQGRGRFRVISGIPDAGAIVPVFAGGDAVSEPLAFGDASQYAAIDAGVYDLDILEAESGVLLLSLPQTPFAEGTTTDVILVGQIGDASLRAIVHPIQVELAQTVGRSAQVIAGECGDGQEPIAGLGAVQTGQGDQVGAAGTVPVAQGFGVAAIPFSALLASPHAISVSEDGESGGGIVACGEIGGTLTDTGAMVIALGAPGSGTPSGVAVLAPALEDPNATGVSIFLIADVALEGEAATPVGANE